MYPTPELDALAGRKNALRLRIAAHREQCMVAGAELAKPVAWLDSMVERWRTISPLAKMVGVPLGMILLRKFTKRGGGGLKLLQFAPLIFRTARTFVQARGRNGASVPSGS